MTEFDAKIAEIRKRAERAAPLYTLSRDVCQQDPLKDGAIRAEMVPYLQEVSDPVFMLEFIKLYCETARKLERTDSVLQKLLDVTTEYKRDAATSG